MRSEEQLTVVTTVRIPAIKVILLPKDTNAHGTIFGGVILSNIDLASAIEARAVAAHRYVTKAMREVEFHEPVFVGDVRAREHLLSASITVDTAAEIKQLFLDFKTAGVRFHQTLRKEPWGARSFIVLDPDGNLILFAGPAD